MMVKKEEAEAAIDLMLAQFERIRLDESRRKGLIILTAYYGHFPNDSNDPGNYF